MAILSEITEKAALKTCILHSSAKLRLQQHCVAISAIAGCFFLLHSVISAFLKQSEPIVSAPVA